MNYNEKKLLQMANSCYIIEDGGLYIYYIKWEDVFFMVFEKVKKIIKEQLGVDEKEIKPYSSFIEDLGADSLDIVELVMAMESEFDMEIDDDDVENISTVEDVVNYIKENSDLD